MERKNKVTIILSRGAKFFVPFHKLDFTEYHQTHHIAL